MVEEHTGQPRTRLRAVLVDDEDGLRTLLRSMLDQHGCCEIVAYTACTDEGTTERFLEAGASRVFHKSDLDDLVAYVASCAP
jgi:hypothetical protein